MCAYILDGELWVLLIQAERPMGVFLSITPVLTKGDLAVAALDKLVERYSRLKQVVYT